MAPVIDVHLALAPFAKERPRFSPLNMRAVTSRKTRAQEEMLAVFARQAWRGPALTAALRVELLFDCRAPMRPTRPYPSRLDVDNAAKAVLDALNGVYWKDDRQVVELVARKRFAPKDSIHIRVSLWQG